MSTTGGHRNRSADLFSVEKFNDCFLHVRQIVDLWPTRVLQRNRSNWIYRHLSGISIYYAEEEREGLSIAVKSLILRTSVSEFH